MPNRLFIRPIEQDLLNVVPDEYRFDWCLYDVSGNYVSSGTANSGVEINELLSRNAVSDFEIVMLVAASHVYCTNIKLAAKQKRFLQQALPFAIEEQLSQDLEHFHLAHGAFTKSGIPVVAINHTLMEALIGRAAEFGSTLQGIYADALLLPSTDQDICISLEADFALIKTNDGFALRLGKAELAKWLDVYLKSSSDESAEQKRLIQLLLTPAQKEHERIIYAQLEQLENTQVNLEVIQVPPLQLLCECWIRNRHNQINLCQKEYKQGKEVSSPLKPWYPAGIAASLLALAVVSTNFVEATYYERKSEVVFDSALTAYKKINPNSSRVNTKNLNRQIKGELKNLGAEQSDSGFVELLALASEPYTADFSSVLTWTSVSYSDKRNELVVELQANGFETLERFKQELVSRGLKVEVNTAVKESQFLRGRISISA